ncbi:MULTISPECIES: hypothetical protein [Dickeya]|uniref:hypothetical protein n=1 Tax=Dickeya TaxID=204037 RepID=UPI0005561809|nr:MULTISPECIES: hypothetical protein [Dickeya]
MTLGRSLFFLLSLALVSSYATGAEKWFDGVTCNTDIPSALIGRHTPNDRVVTIEGRYKNIGLENHGAFGIEEEGDPWTLTFWQICGREYLLLERRSVVKDVLMSPLPKENPASKIVSCDVDDTNSYSTAITFIPSEETPWPKQVKQAWIVDDKKLKFSKIEGKKIVCNP